RRCERNRRAGPAWPVQRHGELHAGRWQPARSARSLRHQPEGRRPDPPVLSGAHAELRLCPRKANAAGLAAHGVSLTQGTAGRTQTDPSRRVTNIVLPPDEKRLGGTATPDSVDLVTCHLG